MELPISKKWKDKDISPERTKVWTEPGSKSEGRVPVVYYLSRKGQLQHPHFMEVPLSSRRGLYLRDVVDRLNSLRGKGMASLYSWSAKRRYNNGFVWHDLAENDFIYPEHGHEYILKGSELMDGALIPSSAESKLEDVRTTGNDREFLVAAARRHNVYRVHNTESIGESSGKAHIRVPTQTYDKPLLRVVEEEEEEEKVEEEEKISDRSRSTELSRGEISPPPSGSSPETLETLMKADGRLILVNEGQTATNYDPTVKPRPGSVVMQILSCGSIAVRERGPCQAKGHRFSLVTHHKAMLPRGTSRNQVEKEAENATVELPLIHSVYGSL